MKTKIATAVSDKRQFYPRGQQSKLKIITVITLNAIEFVQP